MQPLRSIKEILRPRWLKVGRKWLASRLTLGRLSRRYGLQPLSSNPWGALRKSDTLYILGSGASINTLGSEEWAAISAADSVGFNNWMLHPFIPTFFVTEPGKDLSQLALEYGNLARRGYADARVPILIKDGERYRYGEMCHVLATMPQELRPLVTLSWDWEMQEQRLGNFRRYLRLLDRLGMIAAPRCPSLRKRASLFNLVILALRAGYRHVVLCGIDLTGNRYFFEDYRDELVAQGYWLPTPAPKKTAHKTNDPGFGEITIAKALQVLREEVLARHGVELSVALKSSGLFPMLPAHFSR